MDVSKSGSRSKFPLHLHISTIFVIMMVLVCSVQIFLTERSLSKVLLEANSTLFDRISSETNHYLSARYGPAFDTVSMLSRSAFTSATSLEDQLNYVDQLGGLLGKQENVTTYTMSFTNGNFFAFGHIEDELMKADLNSPANAKYFMIRAFINDPTENLVVFFNTEFDEIERRSFKHEMYDPRERDWYTQATIEKATLSKPYYFRVIQQVGATIHRKAENGVVIGADILLSNISKVLEDTATKRSSVRVLYDSDNVVYATNSPQLFKLEQRDLNNRIMSISDLSDKSIEKAIRQLSVSDELQSYDHDGEKWFGKIFSVPINEQLALNFLLAAKASDMLDEASLVRRDAILLSIIILLIAIPAVFLLSQKISKPIRKATEQAKLISRFDFTASVSTHTYVREIHELSKAVTGMKNTISNYFELTNKISKENDFDELVKLVGRSTAEATDSKATYLYLLDDKDAYLEPHYAWRVNSQDDDMSELTAFALNDERLADIIDRIMIQKKPFESLVVDVLSEREQNAIGIKKEKSWTLTFPLFDRSKTVIGVMVLVFDTNDREQVLKERLSYFESLTHYMAIALDGRKMLADQKALLEAFIKVMAGAIDTKSPYTGNHCQKVPVLTQWLAEAAQHSTDDEFKSFKLTSDEWEELNIASWLHDCGKVTTPEYVVDKACKLETIYNRIHEIRTRFEVLKRDAELAQWRNAFGGSLPEVNQAELLFELERLDKEFEFIAKANEGGEFFSDDDKSELERIGKQEWYRTLDNSIGLSWEEKARLETSAAKDLPYKETLLRDHGEHLVPRTTPHETDARFTTASPEYKNNMGELYNLSIQRGTLNDEERFAINDHIVQTILMLEALPFPKTMSNIPAIAGGHHEKMNGKGYPMGLTDNQMPLTARMMAVADIFEALTSSDRPYKKAKTLSESIKIMSFMVKDQHIDAELFKLFLSSGLYKRYGEQFLLPEQCDEVDISQYLG